MSQTFRLHFTLKVGDEFTEEDFVTTVDSVVMLLKSDKNLQIQSVNTDFKPLIFSEER